MPSYTFPSWEGNRALTVYYTDEELNTLGPDDPDQTKTRPPEKPDQPRPAGGSYRETAIPLLPDTPDGKTSSKETSLKLISN